MVRTQETLMNHYGVEKAAQTLQGKDIVMLPTISLEVRTE